MAPHTVLLMRHGEAVDEAPLMGDRGRWLTAHGRAQTRIIAERLRNDVDPIMLPGTVWTSPYVRAVQTADIVVELLKQPDEIQAIAELALDGSPRTVAQMLRNHPHTEPVLVVGHEPSLSNLAVILMDGGAWGGFVKSGLLAISLDPVRKAGKRVFVLNP